MSTSILRRKTTKWVILMIAGVVAVVAWPLAGGSLGPTLISGMVILFFAYAWNVVGGILGELALVNMVFWGIGSYGLVLSMNNGTGFILPVLVATVISAILGALIVRMASALGLTGLYLAVFTLIIFEIAAASVTGINILGRNEGIIIKEFTSIDAIPYVLIGIIVLAVATNLAILTSSMGRRWLSIKDDAVAAQAVGVSVRRERMIAYAISGGLTAIGGAVQAFYLGYAQPETALGIDLLVTGLLAVFVGGAGTILGPAIGTVIVFGLEAIATTVSRDIQTSLYAQILQYAVAFVIIWVLSVHKSSRNGIGPLIKSTVRRMQRKPPLEPIEVVNTTAGNEPSSLIASDPPDPSVDAIIEVIDVSKRFGGIEVLRNVTMSVRPGEIVGLMGPNGAGKTTICNVITGVIRPDRGEVKLMGADITGLTTAERYHRGISRSFQAARLFTSMGALDNVLVGGASEARARELLLEYGLGKVKNTMGAPTFVRRLIEICRLVAADKPVLLLDEPLAGLTADQQSLVLRSVQRLAAQGCAIVLVEHLIQSIAPVCHRLVVMAGGQVIASGVPSDVLNDPEVVDAYLGAPLEETA